MTSPHLRTWTEGLTKVEQAAAAYLADPTHPNRDAFLSTYRTFLDFAGPSRWDYATRGIILGPQTMTVLEQLAPTPVAPPQVGQARPEAGPALAEALHAEVSALVLDAVPDASILRIEGFRDSECPGFNNGCRHVVVWEVIDEHGAVILAEFDRHIRVPTLDFDEVEHLLGWLAEVEGGRDWDGHRLYRLAHPDPDPAPDPAAAAEMPGGNP